MTDETAIVELLTEMDGDIIVLAQGETRDGLDMGLNDEYWPVIFIGGIPHHITSYLECRVNGERQWRHEVKP